MKGTWFEKYEILLDFYFFCILKIIRILDCKLAHSWISKLSTCRDFFFEFFDNKIMILVFSKTSYMELGIPLVLGVIEHTKYNVQG